MAQHGPSGTGAEVIAPRTAPASQHLSQHHGISALLSKALQGGGELPSGAMRGSDLKLFSGCCYRSWWTNVALKKLVEIYLSACKSLKGCSKSDTFWKKQKKQASSHLRPGSNSCRHISPLSCATLTFPRSEASRDMSDTN